MDSEKIHFNLGEKYSIKYLQEIGIIDKKQNSRYFFHKKDNITYVLYNDIIKHPNEYKIAAIWES